MLILTVFCGVSFASQYSIQPSNYEILEVKNITFSFSKRMVYKILVPVTIKENQIKPTIKLIVTDITKKDKEVDELMIFLYSDKALKEDAYDVARAIWAPNGNLGEVTPKIAQTNTRTNYKTTIEKKEDLEKYLQNRNTSETEFGLSENERKAIFNEIILAEDTAMKEAEQLYPTNIANKNFTNDNVMKKIDANARLSEKYKNDLIEKKNINYDILNKITSEGLEKRWTTK